MNDKPFLLPPMVEQHCMALRIPRYASPTGNPVDALGLRRRLQSRVARWCAQRSLARLGCREHVGGSRLGRPPEWPVGFVGALTHSDRYAAAAVCKAESASGIGIDIEMVTADCSIQPLICEHIELAQCRNHTGFSANTALTLLFSAKEALYKCMAGQQAFEFRELQLAVLEGGLWTLNGDWGTTIFGTYSVADDHVFTAAVMTR